MKKVLPLILFAVFFGMFSSKTNAQIVMKDFLSQSWEGKVDGSVNNGGKPLYYKFEFVSSEAARIHYKLHLYKDASMKTPMVSYDVLMRSLIQTFYVDVFMTKDNSTKVAAMIFKKDLRWSRVKYSPHEACMRLDPPVYERYTIGEKTGAASDLYAGLLQNMIAQLDKNVDFSCYVTK